MSTSALSCRSVLLPPVLLWVCCPCSAGVGGTESAGCKWSDAVVAGNGVIYGIPGSARAVLKLGRDPEGSVTLGELEAGEDKWRSGALAGNGAVYAAPYSASAVLRIDPASDAVSVFGELDGRCCKWGSVVVAGNGIIYGIPDYASAVLRIDPVSESATTHGDLGDGASKWSHGVLARNGAIYALPHASGSVLKIDPRTDSVTTFGDFGAAPGKWECGLTAASGAIYAVPASAGAVLKIGPAPPGGSDSVALLGSLGEGGLKWRSCAAAATGTIYGIPFSAGAVLRVNPVTDEVTTLGRVLRVDPATGEESPLQTLDGGQEKWLHAVPIQGTIVGVPYSAGSALVIEPLTDAVRVIGDLGSGAAKWAAATVSSGRAVYSLPASAGSVLRIDAGSRNVSALGSFPGSLRKWSAGVLAKDGAIYGIPCTAGDVLKVTPGSDSVEELGSLDDGGPGGWRLVAECGSFRCSGGFLLRRDAASRVCRELPCEDACCLPAHTYECPPGYASRDQLDAVACMGASLAEADLDLCCALDLGHPSLLLPLAAFALSGLLCVIRQLIRCRVERLSFESAFKVSYFTLMFAWDVCDQIASWWFWQYTTVVGAGRAIQDASLASALLGTVVVVGAFLGGLCLPTEHLIEYRLPDFAYSLGAGCADVIMLVVVFLFEAEGYNAGSWIKVLNLVATIFDLVLKVLQAGWALWGERRPPGEEAWWRRSSPLVEQRDGGGESSSAPPDGEASAGARWAWPWSALVHGGGGGCESPSASSDGEESASALGLGLGLFSARSRAAAGAVAPGPRAGAPDELPPHSVLGRPPRWRKGASRAAGGSGALCPTQ